MEETGAAIPLPETPAEITPSRAHSIPRWLAAIQVVLVSGVPTQLVMAAVLIIIMRVDPFGPPGSPDGMSLEFMAMTLLLDTALTALLIRVFLEMSGEDSKTVFVGPRPVIGEVLKGLALVPVVFVGITIVTFALRTALPWLHNVSESPYLGYMTTPLETGVFLVVVTLGAGVKEELQRAFVLHRFEHYLGGRRVGLAVFSGWFGLLHANQGLDLVVSIALLGLFWGVLYLKRRSAVMSMVNHASFNAAQVGQVMLTRALGA